MDTRHLYLFTLEVEPLAVGEAYKDLPLHCTLMHRFWSELGPDELAAQTAPVFAGTQPIIFTFGTKEMFGPPDRPTPVTTIEESAEHTGLHMQLYRLLNGLGVTYTAPQWTGEGHRAHVTDRAEAAVAPGTQFRSGAAYLVEVVEGVEKTRQVRSRFEFLAAERDWG